MMDLPWDAEELTVAVDTETSGLYVDDGARVSVVSVAYRDGDELIQQAFPFDQGPLPGKPGINASLFDEVYVGENLDKLDWSYLLNWLRRQRLVFHKAKFDLHILATGHRIWGAGVDLSRRVAWDTKLGAWVLDPTENSSLKPTAERLWGKGERDNEAAVKNYLKKAKLPTGRYDLVPWEIIGPYAASDAGQTLRLFEYQQERLETGDGHLRRFIEQELEISRILFQMERRGIGYDVAASLHAAGRIRAYLRELGEKVPFKPITEAKARKWFYVTKAELPHCVTPGGQYSVKSCCVRQLVNHGVEGAVEYQEYSKAKTADEMWYTGYAEAVGADGRLRTDFVQTGTVSMRFSSQRKNLQALPHDYRVSLPEQIPRPRSLFRPAPGMVLWEFDLGQAELRVATKYAKCVKMRELIESGADVHLATANEIFGRGDFEYRQVAKRANFALIYTVGAITFVADVEKNTGIILSVAEGQDIIDKHHDIYPEFPRVNKRAERKARQAGFVRLIDGRLRWFGANEYDRIHKAFNQVVQGGIAQFMKQWMIDVDRLAPDALLLQIHDSLVCELPESRRGQEKATETPPVAKEIMSRGAQMATDLFGIKMVVDAKQWT